MKIDSFSPPGIPLCVQLGPNPNATGRDLVVGDVHGHFPTLRRALGELQFSDVDRLFSLGDLIDRGPASHEAKTWIHGPNPATRFDLVVRGNHEQMMLEAVSSSPIPNSPTEPWGLWLFNGGGCWRPKEPNDNANTWLSTLASLPFAARIATPHGPVGLVHACPVHRCWHEFEKTLAGQEPANNLTRVRAIWSRVYFDKINRHIGEHGNEWNGPVDGVRAVLTGHTPVRQPQWHHNILSIDTGIAHRGQLTIARIDTPEIETWSFDVV